MKFVIAIDGPAAAGKGTIAAKLVKAGASIIVTGTAIEKNHSCMSEFASAIHWKG